MRRGRETSRRLRREIVLEVIGDAIGAMLLFGGIIGVWFIGCAVC